MRILLLAALFAYCALAQSTPLIVSPQVISLGESITISWDIPEAQKTYITSLGLVDSPQKGSRIVTPSRSMHFTLASSFSDRPDLTFNAELVIRGMKGREGDWPRTDQALGNEYVCITKNLSLADRFNRINLVLSERGFFVDEISKNGVRSLVTKFQESQFIDSEFNGTLSAPKSNALRNKQNRKFRFAMRFDLGEGGKTVITSELKSQVSFSRNWHPALQSDSTQILKFTRQTCELIRRK